MPSTYYPPSSRMHTLSMTFPPPQAPTTYNDTTRLAATSFAAGTWIWNTDDNAPNWSDGTNWRDSDGNLT